MEVIAFTLFHILHVTSASQPNSGRHDNLYLYLSPPLSLSLHWPHSLLVLEGEVPCVETGPRQGSKHFSPIIGSRGQQGLHTGSDVLQVSTAHLIDKHRD